MFSWFIPLHFVTYLSIFFFSSPFFLAFSNKFSRWKLQKKHFKKIVRFLNGFRFYFFLLVSFRFCYCQFQTLYIWFFYCLYLRRIIFENYFIFPYFFFIVLVSMKTLLKHLFHILFVSTKNKNVHSASSLVFSFWQNMKMINFFLLKSSISSYFHKAWVFVMDETLQL